MRKKSREFPILVVDDEPVLRTLISAFLIPEGFNVTTADCGREALHLVEANPISLLITDVQMPTMSGVELALLATRVRPGLPVLLMSGSPPPLQYGWEFLSKPFNCDIFVRSVQRLINQPQVDFMLPSAS